ncbi:histidine phosphatase family protein [Gracilibacillus sp. HCP3S3_G5_1]|uniref:histidine phosphatase family protein n=1 Tax=unclassified Gracilibacillus TaxID=2625209 RepID=UPI003F8C17AE
MLFLIRHGETKWNQEKKLQGQLDIPLSERGMDQVQRLGEYFDDHQIVFEHVYTSDLLRARQTSQIISKNMPVQQIKTDSALRERYYGELEGKYIEEILTIMPDYHTNFGVKMQYGVESLEQVQQRMVSCITAIATQTAGAPTLIVSHGGAINAFLHYITKGKLGTGKGKLANTSITRLQWREPLFNVQMYNDTPHLLVK